MFNITVSGFFWVNHCAMLSAHVQKRLEYSHLLFSPSQTKKANYSNQKDALCKTLRKGGMCSKCLVFGFNFEV